MFDIYKLLKNAKNPFVDLGNELLKTDDYFLNSLGKAFVDLNRGKDKATILSSLNKLKLFDSPSVQSTFIFYLLKSIVEVATNQFASYQLSLSNAKENLLNNDPPHIKYFYAYLEGLFMPMKLRFSRYQKITKKLKISNNFDYWLWTHMSNHLSEEGLLLVDESNRVIKNRMKIDPCNFNILYFIDAVAKGNVSVAKEYLLKIPMEKKHKVVLFQENMMKIIEGDLTEVKFDDSLPMPKVEYKYFNFFIALRKKEAKRALQIAREAVQLSQNILIWPKMLLADAEICNNNIEKGAYLLDQLADDMGLMDYLMLARIEYQKNNLDKCVEYFKYVYHESKMQDKLKYFSFKMKCAIELNGHDVFTIMQKATEPLAMTVASKKNILASNANKDVASLFGANRYIGSSKSSLKVKEEIVQYAKIKMPVLITGETGVGKEIVAQAIHEEGSNPKEPFLPINCGAIVGTLLQSELFGHRAGAFTSAQKNHMGIFEAAGKGTVFLDEFGEMSLEVQVALLRVLETQQVRPIGSTQTKSIHCKIIVATNAKLVDLIKQNKFRSDLYYRLKTFEIKLKPLRKRKKDILELIYHFFNIDKKIDDPVEIDKKAKESLLNYHWPGNTRELKNEIQKVRVLSSDKLKYFYEDFNFLNNFDDSTFDNIKPEVISLEGEMELPEVYNNTHKRIQKIKELFDEHKTIKRIQLIKSLRISQSTATKYLKQLIEEGFIVKVMPTSSSRSHYFELIS